MRICKMARLMNKGQPAMVKNDFDFVSSCIDFDSFTEACKNMRLKTCHDVKLALFGPER